QRQETVEKLFGNPLLLVLILLTVSIAYIYYFTKDMPNGKNEPLMSCHLEHCYLAICVADKDLASQVANCNIVGCNLWEFGSFC
ncbi:hypothetical protein ACMD2_03391, partial [Ananas comosus]